MDKKEAAVLKGRIQHTLLELDNAIYPQSRLLNAEYGFSVEPVKFADREKLSYSAITEGIVWGSEWENAWFHITGSVPKDFAGRELCLKINLGGETLIFDKKGVPVYGLTASSVYDYEYNKTRYVLKGDFKGGEKLDYWMESTANSLWGVGDPAGRAGVKYMATVFSLRLCVFDREMWHLKTEFEILYRLMCSLPEDDYRVKKLLHILTLASDAFNHDPANTAETRRLLKKYYAGNKAAPSAITAHSVGHAHIDIGWLWRVREGARKAARTFSSQIALLEKYPDYIFGASQAHLYNVIKKGHPALYAKIKKMVKAGRWEVQGGMWVEADANIISSESMIRQFVHGKNFFRDEFGVDIRNLWIPDVFGYSAAMPQIIRKCGCEYFLTQKISWSQINRFPHNTFIWEGIDGTSVLTHFPPEDNYNSYVEPSAAVKAQNVFREGGYIDRYMSLIGIGDGGGGPSEDYIERGLLMRDLDGCPKFKFGRADEYFKYLEKYRPELPTWKGELYLELHRGTLTAQARTKRGNRKCEQALVEAEKLWSALPAEIYPATTFDRMWKLLLLNQFHDIIPGSSVRSVYEETEVQHAGILSACRELMASAAEKLFKKEKDSFVAANTLSCAYNGVIELPESWRGYAPEDESGKELPSQAEGKTTFALVNIPGDSFVTVRRGKRLAPDAKTGRGLVLENKYIRYKFSKDGRITEAYDKNAKRNVLSGEGNVLSVYNDYPNNFEAWDIDSFYTREFVRNPECVRAEKTFDGPVRSVIEFEYRIDKSIMTQKVVLAANSKRLDFITVVEWRQRRQMLRTAFPVDVFAADASFDISYAFIKRPMHSNTTWDAAKFETAAHRYADISDSGYGVALLNDCKYGHRVKDSILDLCLLRSPISPDYAADQGGHLFTYSLYPHEGRLEESGVLREGASLNRAPFIADGFAAGAARPLCTVDSDDVSLEVVKKAEKDDSFIVRLVETKGRRASAVLELREKAVSRNTDMIEWNDGAPLKTAAGNKLKLEFKPFEIKTIRIKGK